MAQNQPPQLYGVTPVTENLKTIWERIYGIERGADTETASRFKPTDFVRVMNIDDETFYWQALDPADEKIEMEGSQFLPMKSTYRRDPKIYSIPAGGTMVLEGWNAAIMIEKLYKKMVAKRAEATPLAQGQKIRNFSYSNPDRQNEYIGKIFVSVERPVFEQGKPVVTPATNEQIAEIKADPSVSELAEELGLGSTHPAT